ncbi:MAG: hypothetical protein IJ518_06190 [Clostridia bacterium]|nr:hypothetical protein [Clostridia bacterium]
MVAHILSRRTLQQALVPVAAVAVATVLLAYPQAMATGISRGLSVCTSVIIPTLFPFMVLAGWLADSPLCRQPGRWLCAVTRRLFGLPGCCGPAILLSLVGGYPAGALSIARLLQQGLISPAEAKRMALFCVGGGPGFIISTVGNGLLGSTVAGICLYAAQTGVSLAIGVWLGRGKRQAKSRPPLPLSPPRPVASLVADTCRSLLTMCGFVVLSATVLSLCEGIGLSRLVHSATGVPASWPSAVLAALLEVSCGCIALAGSGELAPFWLSLCISWCGLSVQGQIAAALPGVKALASPFRAWRLLHGLLSGLLSLLLFRLFPVSVSTGGNITAALPYSVSATASFMLLLLSFMAMLCFSGKSTGKIQ